MWLLTVAARLCQMVSTFCNCCKGFYTTGTTSSVKCPDRIGPCALTHTHTEFLIQFTCLAHWKDLRLHNYKHRLLVGARIFIHHLNCISVVFYDHCVTVVSLNELLLFAISQRAPSSEICELSKKASRGEL